MQPAARAQAGLPSAAAWALHTESDVGRCGRDAVIKNPPTDRRGSPRALPDMDREGNDGHGMRDAALRFPRARDTDSGHLRTGARGTQHTRVRCVLTYGLCICIHYDVIVWARLNAHGHAHGGKDGRLGTRESPWRQTGERPPAGAAQCNGRDARQMRRTVAPRQRSGLARVRRRAANL